MCFDPRSCLAIIAVAAGLLFPAVPGLAQSAATEELALVAGGNGMAIIVLPERPEPIENAAAQTLQEIYLKGMGISSSGYFFDGSQPCMVSVKC
jgi:hypothetical protein